MNHAQVLLGLLLLLTSVHGDPDPPSSSSCSKDSPLVGFKSEFTMVQHQLRGLVTVLDDCSFLVSSFDMLSGSSSAIFWSSSALSLHNFTSGFQVSDHNLTKTYRNSTFTVRLRRNVTWDLIRVLAVWDPPTASDFGHLELPRDRSNASRAVDHLAPTMFDNCRVMSKDYRVRWTVGHGVIDIGLESATGSMNYMAFGWANPNETSQYMIGADVAVSGFTENGMPFVDDFFITDYSECTVKDGNAQGVCPDSLYNDGNDSDNGDGELVNSTKLLYGHRKDGVSFIRYQRPLELVDKKRDLQVNRTGNMTVIWALGLMRPPDSLRPYYLPQNHGGPPSVTFGHSVLNVSERVNDCLGPLVAENKEDRDLVIADGIKPLVVMAGLALHYPNPPNPSKVLFINKMESPVLRVERGVPVKFSIQAGHDVALYITSDVLGGNATLRNKTETIYAGGPDAQGVQASPTELIWSPDRNTPDLVYYQSLYQQKMGWKIQVVDGGLPDMYNNSVVLDDQQVTFFWTLSKDSISIAARGEKKSGYLAIGFGSEMKNSYAYVGWVDDTGKGRVNTYWIDGNDASNVHPTNENLTYVRCKSESDIITLEFTRPLKPACDQDGTPECKNIIDPSTPLRVIWAMGARWAGENLSERNMHSVTSSRPIRVLLMRGSAEAEQDLLPVLAVHGFMMFLAWGILLPGGILAVRYLKHVKGDWWFQIHVYLQYSGLSIVSLGLLFAVAELRAFNFDAFHVKIGTVAIFLACAQPVNAYLRPKRAAEGEAVSCNRIIWEYLHFIVGRGAIVAGVVALFSGMKHLGVRYGSENVDGLNWALIIWFLLGACLVVYLEYCERRRKKERSLGRGNWVLGNIDEDDSQDLLRSTGDPSEKEPRTSGRMEVQLEPLGR